MDFYDQLLAMCLLIGGLAALLLIGGLIAEHFED